jgi:hypothetical protein
MVYPVLKLEMRSISIWALIKHEIDLIRDFVGGKPKLCTAYHRSIHYGHILYWWLVGLFAHGPYAYIALGMGALVLLHPLFGGEE